MSAGTTRIVKSVWLPVGRENFYSSATDPQFLDPVAGTWRSARGADAGYVQHLRESVLYRLLDVLPVSFGYQPTGTCVMSEATDEASRPVALTMRLLTATARVGLPSARVANDALVGAGVQAVTLTVHENGWYTFVAEGTALNDATVDGLLRDHIIAVFGGDFTVQRLDPVAEARANAGANAVRRYNGLAELSVGEVAPTESARERRVSPPLGVLSFYQLNIMIESLCNESLLPAVFFERYADAEEWLTANEGRVSVIVTLHGYLEKIITDVDPGSGDNPVAALRQFLVTSRGSLQWMSRSVESVRRSLLDRMMALSYRRASLIQLDLAGISYERTPELTGAATESQMRGYVVLMATKLPLIEVVAQCAGAAVVQVRADSPGERAEHLAALAGHWTGILARLRDSVNSLSDAVFQDWQERLLQEEEQARSEQEAMAEIERSRRGRPDSRPPADFGSPLTIVFTVLAVVIAVPAASADGPLWVRGVALVGAVLLSYLVYRLYRAHYHRRWRRRQRSTDSDTYSYEFAFRLYDVVANPAQVHDFLAREVTTVAAGAEITLRPMGGWRTNKISDDTELIKVHSVAVVPVGPKRRQAARFEIVTEVLIRKAPTERQYFLRHCRIFGDSPEALAIDALRELLLTLLTSAFRPMVADPRFNVERMIDLSYELYGNPAPGPLPRPRTSVENADPANTDPASRARP